MKPAEISREEITRLIFTDDLTGLYNRRFMYRYLTEEIPWKDEHPTPLALIMMDLDAFKAINDTYGHLEGDSVLKQTAQVLRGSCSDPNIVIRYAGDEFSILLPGSSRQEAVALAERVRRRLEETEFARGGKKVKGTVHLSAGVAVFPEDARTAEELIDRADKALYVSKVKGRNKVTDVVQMEQDRKRVLPASVPMSIYSADQDHIAKIMALVGSLEEGQNQFVFVRGGLGVGKIRFLGELIKQVEEGGAVCVVEKCSAPERNTPYRPLLEIMDRFLSAHPVEMESVRKILSDPEWMSLVQEVPVLAKSSTDLKPSESISPEQRRLLLFDGLVKALVSMSHSQTLFLVLDGFQFVDEGTLNVAMALLQGSRGKVIICGALEAGAGGEPELEEISLLKFLEQVQQTGRCQQIVLEPLGQSEITEFLSQILPGRAPSAEFDRLMLDISRGSRLYIEIAVQILISKKIIRYEGDQWVIELGRMKELPTTLDGLVQSQIHLLDKQTGEIISEAAVIGSNFRLDLLKRVAGTNEGEMLDLLDKAKQLRLVDSPQPFNLDELHFVSPEAQQVTYDSSDEEFRRAAHGQVAEAVEDIYKDHLDQAAAQLAFHYDKAGNPEKSKEFDDMARERAGRLFDREEIEQHVRKKGTRSRIKERDLVLSEKDVAMVMNVLRTLSTASKNLFLYPEGSQPIQQAIGQLQETVARVLEKLDGFTVSESKEGLRANNRVLDAKFAGVMGEEILRSMRDRSIRSMTFVRGAEREELLSFARLFGQQPPKGVMDRNYWENLLDNAIVTHIGVIQRAYVLEVQKAKDTGTFLRAGQRPLNEETLFRAAAVIRNMSAAMDNMKLYPAESSIIVYALEQLDRSVRSLFENCDGVNFGEVENALLINGVQANPKVLGAGGTDFARALRNGGIKSCAMVPAIAIDELKIFLKLLGETPSPRKIDAWRSMLAEQNVAHLWVGDTIYTAAAAGTPEKRKPVKVDPTALAGEAAVKKARELCEADPDQLLGAEVVAVLPQILEILVLDRHDDLMKTLLERFTALAVSSQPPQREKTADALAGIYEKSAIPVRDAMLPLIHEAVVEAMRSEKLAGPYRKQILLGNILARQCADRKDYDGLNRVVWAMGRQRIAEDIKRELGGVSKEALTALLNTAGVQAVLQELKSEDAGIQGKIWNILTGFGTAAVSMLIRLIKETEDYSVRCHAARALRASGSEGVKQLLKEVTRYAPAEPCRRILGILEELGEDIVPLVKQTIVHQDEVVRWESLLLIKRLDRRAALDVLLGAAELEDPQMSVFAINSMGELRYVEAVPALSALLKKSKDASTLKAACVALGTMADPSALPLLREIAERKGFLGLKAVYPDEARAAAVWGLGRMEQPEARQAIERLAGDKSPSVRSAVKLALGK